MELRIYKDYLFKVFRIFGKSKRFLFLLLSSFLLLAFLDLIGISLIGPFVLIFFDFDKIQNEWGLFVGFDQKSLALYASIAIVCVFLLRAICVWAINAFILNVSFSRQVELRTQLLEHILLQDYSKRLEKNTGHYTTAIFSYCQQFVQSTLNIFRIIAESLSVIFIIGLLIFTDILLFFIALSFALVVITLMIFFFSRKFVEYGKEKNIGLTTFSNAVHEAVFGIKEIKILNLINFFKDKVNEGAKKAARAEIRLYLFSIVPRYLIETMLVAIICLILLISFYANDNVLDTIAILSVFLVAALRLLPSISLMISAFNAINLDIDAINKLDSELSSLPTVRQDPNQNSKNLNIFDEYNTIELSHINFGYHETELVIKDLSLQIQRGDFIGLLGESGQGKTTMIDLILGINFPKDGTIKVDGLPIVENLEAWRSLIAYLPQETFIVSGTIAENVALGLPKDAINEDKIITAIQKAGLKEFLESLPQGIHTPIGERGLNFSGGQRQRIALARAFYSNRQIFILDESTSALDKGAAQRIIAEMNELTKSGITIILISHNMVNLSLCNRKLRLNQGRLQELPN